MGNRVLTGAVMIDVAFAFVWFLSGLIGSGFIFAYMQGEFAFIAKESERSDRLFAICCAFMGPINMIAAPIYFGTKHGWRLR